jgi:Flp pilus assembly protein TadB
MVNLGNQQQLLIVLAIALIVIVLAVAAFYAIRREATRKAMQRRFGPEYDRLVSEVVQNYRAGHDIVVRHREGNATTEDLRQAMVHYKTLFADLVAMPTDPVPVTRHAA